MMIKKIIVMIFLSVFLSHCYSQDKESNCGSIPIILEDFNVYSLCSLCELDTMEFDLDTFLLEVILLDCRGKSKIKLYGKKLNNLIIEGQYSNSLDTLKEYATAINIENYESSIYVSKYFQPLRDGVWYWNDPYTGKLEKKIIYNKGNVVREEKIRLEDD